VIQSGGGARLPAEALQGLRIARKAAAQKLHRDRSLELRVLGPVDDSHAAAVDFFQDAVPGDCAPCHRVGEIVAFKLQFDCPPQLRIAGASPSNKPGSLTRSARPRLARDVLDAFLPFCIHIGPRLPQAAHDGHSR
jgi:hypothetical protein